MLSTEFRHLKPAYIHTCTITSHLISTLSYDFFVLGSNTAPEILLCHSANSANLPHLTFYHSAALGPTPIAKIISMISAKSFASLHLEREHSSLATRNGKTYFYRFPEKENRIPEGSFCLLVCTWWKTTFAICNSVAKKREAKSEEAKSTTLRFRFFEIQRMGGKWSRR